MVSSRTPGSISPSSCSASAISWIRVRPPPVASARAASTQIGDAYVNNFGDYLLPKVPPKQTITLQVKIENAEQQQVLPPPAHLEAAAFNRVSLVLPNNPPRLDPLVAISEFGRRVSTALPGQTVSLEARAKDDDGDPLKYKWLLADGSGSLSAVDGQKITWKLPARPGLYSVTLFAYDEKGGYTRSSLSLRTGTDGIPFTGRVAGIDTPALAGAKVEVNGQVTLTNPDGFFQINVRDAQRFVVNIRKQGYSLVSQIYDDAIIGGQWTMNRASVTSVASSCEAST